MLDALAHELGFTFDEVEISGDDELEGRYRELIPVVELDGRRVFAYFVPPDVFRDVYADAQARDGDAAL